MPDFEPQIDSTNSEAQAPTVSADFFHGGIRAGLERIRLRLLDLTNRNRLLNFRHAEKSSLRVVNELPDELFYKLTNNGEMLFAPVPKQTTSGVPQISAREYAGTLGISTDFELPFIERDYTTEIPENWVDREIQTLHYPEQLESILSRMYGNARLAIEETGANMLYLIFGFLEWYESDDSSKAHHAPLITLPVTLTRGMLDSRTSTYRYTVTYSGEDITSNLSLQEKMRQDFGINVPELGDEDLPEDYFAKLKPVLAIKDTWKVRRWVTLGFLSFGKQLMYRDLDDRNWPQGKKISEHPRLNEFFHGVQEGGDMSFAADYNIDAPQLEKILPPLIEDADSSQHSALVDALGGKNLVIAGPPGTGKSQTITNLIAAAMAQGKTILFVAEKQAALQVVRKRLDDAGLGIFCLELHSNKSRKQDALGDIAERIQKYRQLADPRELSAKLELLKKDREQLSKYAALINEKFGASSLSIHDIIWAHQRALNSIGFDPHLIEGAVLPNARDLTAEDLSEKRQIGRAFTAHLENILNQRRLSVPEDLKGVAAHPWLGVKNDDLTVLDSPWVIEQLNRVANASLELDRQIQKLNELVSLQFPNLIEDAGLSANASSVERFLSGMDRIPAESHGIVGELLPHIANGSFREHLIEFCDRLERYRRIRSELIGIFGIYPELNPEIIEDLRKACVEIKPLGLAFGSIAELDAFADDMAGLAHSISKALSSFENVSVQFGLQVPATRAGLGIINIVLELISNAPKTSLGFRHVGLESDNALSLLQTARNGAAPIKELRARLGEKVNLNLAPPLGEVRQHLAACANAGWFSFLSKDYRAAKRAFSVMSRKGKGKKQEIIEGYQLLSDYLSSLEAYRENKGHQFIAGQFFDGPDSPFEDLIEAAKWHVQINQRFALEGEEGQKAGRTLWALPTHIVEAFSGPREEVKRNIQALRVAEEAITSGDLVLPEVVRPDNRLEDTASYFEQVSDTAKRAARVFHDNGIPPGYEVSEIPDLVEKIIDANCLKESLEADEALRAILKTSFTGINADVEGIVNTVAFHDHIVNAGLPVAVAEWLLDPGIETRLKTLRDEGKILEDEYKQWSSLQQEFAAHVKLDEKDWFGLREAVGEMGFCEIASRAREAANEGPLLSGWVDYLIARKFMEEEPGLNQLIKLSESGTIAAKSIEAACDFIIYRSLMREVFALHPDLARFSGMTHERIKTRFIGLDEETIKLQRLKMAYMIDQRVVPRGNGRGPVKTYTEGSLLLHEIEKQKRHIPIRDLVRRAGEALQALKPCFMMSPLSVAQYLEPGKLMFDYVVMDEASQLKPEDALGAIARAKQVVVVGDRMQLPPTSFFDRIGSDEVDDEDEGDASAQSLAEAESILDVASALYRPARMLKWHYRSQHDSLIAFSNKEFYKDQLIVFPSPVASNDQLGVKFVHVTDGVYQGSKNFVEAQRVVDDVLEHMHDCPKESLIVVTLNIKQRDLIRQLFDERMKGDAYAQRYVEEMEGGLEPFDIKNLENVQGDERDVIFISVTYGPDNIGNVYQRFGPINGAMGHRRLNVLFTRAKKRVRVFSSMLPGQIQVQAGSHWGVRALRGYLEFAQTGRLDYARATGREPDSDFEIEVADVIRSRGYEVDAQIGVSGYFIDLAVRHPNKSGEYVLGIECDGATYHSSRSARDRDRLRQTQLERLEWKIHRIWSTDWFKNSAEETKRLLAHIESLIS
jgi:very-short-patch-repair endonuclease